MEGIQDESEAMAAIESEFESRWGIWRSTSGTWWAARRHPISAAGQSAGCVPYLRAPSLGELSRRVREQEELRVSAESAPEAREADERTGDPRQAEVGAAVDELVSVQEEFPAFGIWKEVTGERTRYVARRIRGDHGLHTVITSDLIELRAVLNAEPIVLRPDRS